MRQITDTILMVRPAAFGSNEETAVNNYYQKNPTDISEETIQFRAVQEFDSFVEKLRAAGVNVIVVKDTKDPKTTDAVFPNNWVSFHENGSVGVYPMFAESRRLERREDVLDILEEEGFHIDNVIDYTSAEEEELYLEGTGSLLLDRVNRKAYCAISARSDEDLFIEFCEDFEYTPVPFIANQTVDGERLPIYHTNVMMCLAEDFAVICLESIDDKKERKNVLNHLKTDGKEVIAISEKQVAAFAGNMLQVMNNEGERILVMSESAYNSLNQGQIDKIEKHCRILYSNLEMIELCGGGSARCMMAEVFLPKA